MNAKQRRVARRAAARRPVFLVEALGRTYAATPKGRSLAKRIRVEPITVNLDA